MCCFKELKDVPRSPKSTRNTPSCVLYQSGNDAVTGTNVEAVYDEFPWMVAVLRVDHSNVTSYIGGGTLIHERAVCSVGSERTKVSVLKSCLEGPKYNPMFSLTSEVQSARSFVQLCHIKASQTGRMIKRRSDMFVEQAYRM